LEQQSPVLAQPTQGLDPTLQELETQLRSLHEDGEELVCILHEAVGALNDHLPRRIHLSLLLSQLASMQVPDTLFDFFTRKQSEEDS
jgi:hypothetical protein